MKRTSLTLTAAFVFASLIAASLSAHAEELTDRVRKQPLALETAETRAAAPAGAKTAFAIVDAAIAEKKWTPEIVAHLRLQLPAMDQLEIDALMLKIATAVNSQAVIPTNTGDVFP